MTVFDLSYLALGFLAGTYFRWLDKKINGKQPKPKKHLHSCDKCGLLHSTPTYG